MALSDLIRTLDLDVVATSESETGLYAEPDGLAIYHLIVNVTMPGVFRDTHRLGRRRPALPPRTPDTDQWRAPRRPSLVNDRHPIHQRGRESWRPAPATPGSELRPQTVDIDWAVRALAIGRTGHAHGLTEPPPLVVRCAFREVALRACLVVFIHASTMTPPPALAMVD